MEIAVLSNLSEKGLKLQKLPSYLFSEVFYINYNNALRECRIKKVKYRIKTTYSKFSTKFVLDIAGVGKIVCNNMKVYSTLKNFKDNNGEYLISFINGGLYIPVIDVINQLANREVCFHNCSTYTNSIGTYKWNGVEARYCNMVIPNEIIQTKEGFSFSENCMTFEKCFASKEECEQANAIKVVTFAEDDNHNQVVECIGELGTKCQEIREILNELSNIVGINAIEGKHTKIDNDIITQGLLSQWRENLEPMENFCVD